MENLDLMTHTTQDADNSVLREDLQRIFSDFTERDKLAGTSILITGCAGFLGYYFLQFFCRYAQEIGIKRITALDNFQLGRPQWIDQLAEEFKNVLKLEACDITSPDIASINGIGSADYVLHMASIASPIYYRKFPIETVDANIWGLRRLLDIYDGTDLKGFLFFSSSEIYGDPVADEIPTREEYRGNVASMGPRACYDEAKRFGETLCYLYAKEKNMPITIVRPFNNYGPGMRLDDRRAPADFANAVLNGEDIIIHSDGAPTRTFCYLSDAITGYLKTLVYDKFDVFNIGIDKPEISIRRLAEIYVEKAGELNGYTGKAEFIPSEEKDYLTDNPNRRCPNIDKARSVLGFNPSIEVEKGVERFLRFHLNKAQASVT